MKIYATEGCTNFAQNGGVCVRHGAKVKVELCSSEECRTKPRKEECVRGMGQSATSAVE